MSNKELQEKLKQFPDDWPVVAQDGLDPSDLCEITELKTREGVLGMRSKIQKVISLNGDGECLHSHREIQ